MHCVGKEKIRRDQKQVKDRLRSDKKRKSDSLVRKLIDGIKFDELKGAK